MGGRGGARGDPWASPEPRGAGQATDTGYRRSHSRLCTAGAWHLSCSADASIEAHPGGPDCSARGAKQQQDMGAPPGLEPGPL